MHAMGRIRLSSLRTSLRSSASDVCRENDADSSLPSSDTWVSECIKSTGWWSQRTGIYLWLPGHYDKPGEKEGSQCGESLTIPTKLG